MLTRNLFKYGYRTDEFQAYQRLAQMSKIRPSFVNVKYKNPKRKNKFDLDYRAPAARNLPVWLEGYCGIKPDDSDIASVVDGIKHRVGGITPSVVANRASEFKLFVSRFLDKYVPVLPETTDVSVEHWLQSTDYPEVRKDQLREAAARVDDRSDKQNPLNVKSFIKEETYWEPKAQRTINSRVDEFKTKVGPWIHAVEKVVFKLKWFIKTIPVAERASVVLERLSKLGSIKMATDFTAFESSFREIIMDACEFQLFEHCTKNIPNASSFMENYRKVSMNNKLLFDSVVANIAAKRMSGEMSTSIANGFTNLMLILFTAFKMGIPFDEIDLFVEGDDSIISAPVQLTTKYFEELGFSVKMETFTDIRHASFCGLIFSEPGHIIRDPRPVLAKFGWAMRQYVGASESTLRALLRAKALSLACEFPNCPILSPFAHRVMELTRSVNINKILLRSNQQSFDMYQKAKLIGAVVAKPWQVPPNILPVTRVLMERLFGIPVDLQYVWEEQLSQVEFGAIDLIGADAFLPRDWNHNWNDYVRDANMPFAGLIRRNMARLDAFHSALPDNAPSDYRGFDWVRHGGKT